MSKIISLTTARENIYTIAEEVSTKSIHYIFTEKGKGKVVMMSLEEFEAWQETLEILQVYPEIERDIAQAEKEYLEKQTVTLKDYLKK